MVTMIIRLRIQYDHANVKDSHQNPIELFAPVSHTVQVAVIQFEDII